MQYIVQCKGSIFKHDCFVQQVEYTLKSYGSMVDPSNSPFTDPSFRFDVKSVGYFSS